MTISKALARFSFFFITLFFIVALVVLKPDLTSVNDYNLVNVILIMVMVLVMLHLYINGNGNLFRIDVIFILGFVIVHFQWPMMLSVSGIEPKNFSQLFTNFRYMNYGVWLSFVGLLFWVIGFNSKLNFRTNPKSESNNEFIFEKINSDWFRIITWILFILFLVAAGPSFITGSVYKEQGSAEAVSGLAGYIYTFFHISIIALTAIEIYKNRFSSKKGLISFGLSLNKSYVLLASSYCIIFLIAGDRGGPLQLVIAYLIVYSSLIKHISALKFSFLVVVAAIGLTIIGFTRAGNFDQIGSENESSVYEATLSLASSARTIYLGLYQVPEHDDYFYGRLWLGNLLGIVPMLQSVYIELTGEKAYYLNSANYITYLRYGDNPHTGEGSSVIIDVYLNFGTWGVVLIFWIFGLLTRTIQDRMIEAHSMFWVVGACLYGCTMFYISRATLFIPLQMVVWGLILSLFFVKRTTRK